MKKLKNIFDLIKCTIKNGAADNVMTLSSALAYTTVFSIAPLLIISIGLVGFFLGTQQSSGTVFRSIREMLGNDGALAIEGMVQAASKKPDAGLVATLVGVFILIFGAASVFQQLQQSLNFIWKVRPKPKNGIWNFIRQRLLSFSMVIAIAFLLLVSLLIDTSLSVIGTLLVDRLPGGKVVWNFVNFGFSLTIISFLFAAIFKILPDVKLEWRDVSLGACVTALLFVGGKIFLGVYLGQGSVASAYGAVGSLVVVLVWVYYSSAIVFYGAEFTRVYLIKKEKHIHATENAELLFIQAKPESNENMI